MYTVDSGDTAFILLCTALVCLMTPGLAFFYGGLVRRKNVLTIMMQSFISMGVIAVIWIFGGFSLAFGPDVGGVIGDITYHFALDKVGAAPSSDYATTVPFLLFFAYQLMSPSSRPRSSRAPLPDDSIFAATCSFSCCG